MTVRSGRSRARLAVTGLAVAVIAGGSAAPALAADILGLNTPPVTLPDAYVTTMGRELNVSIAQGVLANDLDVDGDELKSRDDDSAEPRHGDLNLDNEGSFRYRPDSGFTGVDTFGYLADDGDVMVPALVTITILPLATPAPTPTKTPAPTPKPTPVPTPTPAPSVLPSVLPTLPPILPTLPPLFPTPTPRATSTPTPSGTPGPSATPSPGPAGSTPPTTSSPTPTDPGSGTPQPTSDATARPTQRPAPSRSPEPAAAGGSGGGGSPPPELTIPLGGGGGADGAGAPQAVELTGASLVFSGGVFEWAVPGAVLAVPGLLVLLAVGLQVVAGAVWLPVTRRRLGAFGVHRRS